MHDRPVPDSLVSVVIPVAVPTHFLPTAIGSALAQTPYKVEVIVVVNPCALEPPVETSLQSLDATTRVIHSETDVSIGALLKIGSDQAQGQYLTCLFPDDILDPRKIAAQVRALENLGTRAAVTCGIRVHHDLEVLPAFKKTRRFPPQHESSRAAILASFLDGTRSARTLLVPVSCLDTNNNSSAFEQANHELALLLALDQTLPFVHLSSCFVRTHSSASAPADPETMNLRSKQVWMSILDHGTLSLAELATLATVEGGDAHLIAPDLHRRVGVSTNGLALTVAVVSTEESSIQDLGRVVKAAALPQANFVSIPKKQIRPATFRQLASDHESEWLVVIEGGVLLAPEILTAQLSEAIRRNLVACLPVIDNLEFEFSQSVSLLPGTLFKRSALLQVDWDPIADEPGFWMEVLQRGEVGGLTKNSSSRPAAFSEASPKLTIEDLVATFVDSEWYTSTYRDVAAAGADPFEHYLSHGWREGRNPNTWFNTALCINDATDETDHASLGSCFNRDGLTRAFNPIHFSERIRIARHFVGTLKTPDLLLKFVLPGLGRLAEKKGWTLAAARNHAFKALPQIGRMVDQIQSPEFPDYDLLSQFVDDDWYRRENPDVARSGIAPAEHYLQYGWAEGRDPNPCFDTGWYVETNPCAGKPDHAALEHFILHGAPAGRSPHPRFNLRWYARRYLKDTPLSADVLLHFLYTGANLGYVPDPRLDRREVGRLLESVRPEHRKSKVLDLQQRLSSEQTTCAGLIDIQYYYANRVDVRAAGIDAIWHYLSHGWRENQDPNPWFDTSWYTNQYLLTNDEDICPLLHYVRTGAAEGHRPSPGFDTVWYGSHYLNALSPSSDALLHFVSVGFEKGNVPQPELMRADIARKVGAAHIWQRQQLLTHLGATVRRERTILSALVDSDWYRSEYAEHLDANADPVSEYFSTGWKRGHEPNPWFNSQWYHKQNCGNSQNDVSPLEHFVREGAALGLKPHPLFDNAWYSSYYLGNETPNAEAFLHFMKIGFSSGNVPDARLSSGSSQQRLQSLPAEQRQECLVQCLALLSQSFHASLRYS